MQKNECLKDRTAASVPVGVHRVRIPIHPDQPHKFGTGTLPRNPIC